MGVLVWLGDATDSWAAHTPDGTAALWNIFLERDGYTVRSSKKYTAHVGDAWVGDVVSGPFPTLDAAKVACEIGYAAGRNRHQDG